MTTGAGKTTLLNALASHTPLSSGRVLLDGRRMSRKMKREVSYVQQADIFFPNLTLRETLRVSEQSFSSLPFLPFPSFPSLPSLPSPSNHTNSVCVYIYSIRPSFGCLLSCRFVRNSKKSKKYSQLFACRTVPAHVGHTRTHTHTLSL